MIDKEYISRGWNGCVNVHEIGKLWRTGNSISLPSWAVSLVCELSLVVCHQPATDRCFSFQLLSYHTRTIITYFTGISECLDLKAITKILSWILLLHDLEIKRCLLEIWTQRHRSTRETAQHWCLGQVCNHIFRYSTPLQASMWPCWKHVKATFAMQSGALETRIYQVSG